MNGSDTGSCFASEDSGEASEESTGKPSDNEIEDHEGDLFADRDEDEAETSKCLRV